ncbi:DUF6879 family protein [Streptomyces sp. NPDC003860]
MPGKSIGELFDTFEREAFRLETLDDYSKSGNSDAYHAFLSGQAQPDDYNEAWVSEVRGNTASGKRMYRVHVLSRPLTPYLRFELGWGYWKNMAAGEEFFILDTTEIPNPLGDVEDFWLFDAESAVVMYYSDGAVSGRETVVGDPAREFVTIRDVAMAHAEPFSDWWVKYADA